MLPLFLSLLLRVFERRHKVGGRLGTVTLAGDSFEARGSIIRPRNLHARHFADLLGLAAKVGGDDDCLGIWDGKSFIFQTLRPPPIGSSWWRRKLHSLLNSLLLLRRYGLSLLKMDKSVQINSSFSTEMLQRFMFFYNGLESRPVFATVEEMLQWTGLYGLTRRTLEEELLHAGLNTQTIAELVTGYFGVNSASNVPELIGTLELPDIPFSCISVLKRYSEDDMAYKMFSRAKLDDGLLDQIFSRPDEMRLQREEAPEEFGPIVLDGKQLYYVNTFESAASAIETGSVAAENVARLIISRLSLPQRGVEPDAPHIKSFAEQEEEGSQHRHVDL
ncbi:unnamed protein product [Miscanthus lutarioriparius]|uniref:Prenylcysteine lyase domain-containing protein n=1 Tax=Miscanthus lutarioriparius TaxID=422564 RepID=A0A811QKH7_9POAL|nr:unnamed protein product [Miscanthus lutarioriparius]